MAFFYQKKRREKSRHIVPICYFNVYMLGQVGVNIVYISEVKVNIRSKFTWGHFYAKFKVIRSKFTWGHFYAKLKVIRSKFTWGHFHAKLKVILFTSWVKGLELGNLHVGWLCEDYWLSIKVLLPRV